jgi:hypothetical protein
MRSLYSAALACVALKNAIQIRQTIRGGRRRGGLEACGVGACPCNAAVPEALRTQSWIPGAVSCCRKWTSIRHSSKPLLARLPPRNQPYGGRRTGAQTGSGSCGGRRLVRTTGGWRSRASSREAGTRCNGAGRACGRVEGFGSGGQPRFLRLDKPAPADTPGRTPPAPRRSGRFLPPPG